MASTQAGIGANGQPEAGWVTRLATRDSSGADYQELKFAIHRKLLDRINLEALSSLASERARTEIRVAVAKLVDEDLRYSRHYPAPRIRGARRQALPYIGRI
jgi:hypothetical protein